MIECKICGLQLKKACRHFCNKHNMTFLEYIQDFHLKELDYNICNAYRKDKKSARQIIKDIEEKTKHSFNKKEVLDFLRKKKVRVRNTSEAVEAWSKQRGGPWNKGLTKHNHPSIMKYAKDREGKNNPIFSISREARNHYWDTKKEEEVAAIRQRAGDSLKLKYRNGKTHWWNLLSEKEKQKRKRLLAKGWEKWKKSVASHPGSFSSAVEKKIEGFLTELELKYISQYSVGRYFFDFYLPDYNIAIEFNGSYWHADPRIYEATYFCKAKGKYAKEIWEHDKSKYKKGREIFDEIVIIWEEDIRTLTNEEFKSYVNEAIQSKID